MSAWEDRVAAFAATQDVSALLADADDSQSLVEAERLYWMSLAAGWFTAFADPDYPDFVPAVNTHLNCVGTNPDFVYATASIDGAGSWVEQDLGQSTKLACSIPPIRAVD